MVCDTRSDFDRIVYWMDSDGPMTSDPKQLENHYDIMHYAFVNINSDFSIDDSKISISNFLDLNIKKVASFGGWDFSTNPSTYKIFRDIVSDVNSREKFATNVVNFLKKYNLDGNDLDWEYPKKFLCFVRCYLELSNTIRRRP
ncbi:DEHA2B11396p [Debaryomyces hansenii CBS767]|uniref:DEHA2B11396p n=1 Tax=Debaryomyces hansenii (strain ATCC 36239 / CBS 767 / BCRC 21394 / JCM 1990 / NBRC 0083 / IGC 2968) TaxID=284592 RepID=Q6BWH2_DEBHA|nr:DEHA2B11396p [Debaryomyces hansenii CBS767]CAG85451.1 DEHA2B11396p [Debaryomyces hansenii CBS767]|eukprot:XP_457447.1 DEHA2B11396p [Debaryomyces hansenii CBS767]